MLIVEGWFLGVPMQAPDELLAPLNAREADEDGDGRWRRACNHALADYTPLWQRLDWLTWLQPPSWGVVADWRWQQERQALAARPGRAGMARRDVDVFLRLFERIGRHALRTLPAIADRTVALDVQRVPRR